MKIQLAIFASIISTSLIAQKITNKHLIDSNSIQYVDNLNAFDVFAIRLSQLSQDSVTLITKVWIGKRRITNRSIVELMQYSKEPPLQNYGLEFVIYKNTNNPNQPYYDRQEPIQKKFLPPFKYKGVGLIEYWYKGKKYYHIIKSIKKKIWFADYISEAPPNEDPFDNGYRHKQQ